MGSPRPWWRQRRVKHRDAVTLCVLSSAFLLAGEIANPVLAGLGVGLTSLSLVSRLAYYTLVFGSPLPFLVPRATTLTGAGVLCRTAAHMVMGQYALLLKKQAWAAWRRWRRVRRAEAGGRARA